MIININVIEDKFYYNNKEYTREEIRDIVKNIKNKVKINILSSNLFIKKYDFSIKRSYESFIEEKINSDFHEKDKFLFHYENLKKEKKIYLYAIRNDKFKFVYKDIKNIEINPIQFIIAKYIIKKYKKYKNIIVIYSLDKKYNLLNIDNKKIEDFISCEDIDSINLYLKENNQNIFIIIDKNLEVLKFEKYNDTLNLKEEIYEKIYKI